MRTLLDGRKRLLHKAGQVSHVALLSFDLSAPEALSWGRFQPSIKKNFVSIWAESNRWRVQEHRDTTATAPFLYSFFWRAQMPNDGYSQFCPVAKACEIIEPRWTLLILCEMWSGSTRFNDIRRGVPGISPTLLSKRLKEMEIAGLIKRYSTKENDDIKYLTTDICKELEPIVHTLGKWAHKNIDSDVTLECLDVKLLMWNVRRKIDTSLFPKNKATVIQFIYPELSKLIRNYWLIARPGMPIDLCTTNPRHDVDLYITAELRAMTSAWMGLSSLRSEISSGRIRLVGNNSLVATIDDWMVRSLYAPAKMDNIGEQHAS